MVIVITTTTVHQLHSAPIQTSLLQVEVLAPMTLGLQVQEAQVPHGLRTQVVLVQVTAQAQAMALRVLIMDHQVLVQAAVLMIQALLLRRLTEVNYGRTYNRL